MVPVVDLDADDASTTPPSRKHVLLGDDVRLVNDGELPSVFDVETPFYDSSARSMNVHNSPPTLLWLGGRVGALLPGPASSQEGGIGNLRKRASSHQDNPPSTGSRG